MSVSIVLAWWDKIEQKKKKKKHTRKYPAQVQVGCVLTCMFRLGVLTGVHGLCTKKKSTQSKGVKAKLQTGFLFAGDVLTNKLRGAVKT